MEKNDTLFGGKAINETDDKYGECICTPEMHAKIGAAKAQFTEKELRSYAVKKD